MPKRRFTEAQIDSILAEHRAGATVRDLSARHGVSEQTIRRWRSKFPAVAQPPAASERQAVAPPRRVVHAPPPPSAPVVDDSWFGMRGGPIGWLVFLLLCLAGVSTLVLLLVDQEAMQEHEQRISWVLQQLAGGPIDFTALPDHRLPGAFLANDSQAHCGFAAATAAVFFAMLALAFPRAQRLGYLLVAGFTAVAGIALLLGFQEVASWQLPVDKTPAYLQPLVWLVNLIGRSYGLMASPLLADADFFTVLWTFLLTAGLCEEICKALPYLCGFGERVYGGTLGHSAEQLFTWGFASGIGFGIGEGIHYSIHSYNGVVTFEPYVVRFAAVVTLHGVWAASAALQYHKLQSAFATSTLSGPYGWVWRAIRVVAMPALLHALYDACASTGQTAASIGVAVLSVGWLGWAVVRTADRV